MKIILSILMVVVSLLTLAQSSQATTETFLQNEQKSKTKLNDPTHTQYEQKNSIPQQHKYILKKRSSCTKPNIIRIFCTNYDQSKQVGSVLYRIYPTFHPVNNSCTYQYPSQKKMDTLCNDQFEAECATLETLFLSDPCRSNGYKALLF